jgi:hypothetical protein
VIELVLHFSSEGAWNAESMRVKGRGALLGPEESGRVSLETWTGFSGSLLHRLLGLCGSGGWCGWVAGAGSHQTVGVGVLLLGVLFPWGGVFTWQVVVWGWCSCPYFENCIVDASISL